MSKMKVHNLPADWSIASLCDCAAILDSKRIPLNSKQRADRIEGKKKPDLYPYYGATGKVGVIDDYIFEGEHLLIGEDGAPFFDKRKNVAYLVKGKFWVNNHAHILESNNDITTNQYLLYFLNSFNYEGFVGGTTRLKLNQSSLKSIPVILAPLEQQKHIVAKIEELFSHIDAGISALNKSKQLLNQYRQSVLKAAVTGELTKQWRQENKDKLEPSSELLERILIQRRETWEEQRLTQLKAKGEKPKGDKWKEKYREPLKYSYEGNLRDLPSSWVWASPEELASTDRYSLSIGPFGSNLKVPDYREEGVPLVFIRNIRSHSYSLPGAKFVTPEKAETLKAHSISGGDVLITKMGEPPGDASFYPLDAQDAIITADCIKWRFSELIEQAELYVHFINSSFIKTQIISRTKGVAQKKVSLGTFKSIAFPLPSRLEQREIFSVLEKKLDSIARLQSEVDKKLLKAERTKQSILASAFSGKLI